MKLCWADRLALWLSAILAIVLWLLHSLGPSAADTPDIGSIQALSLFLEIWWIVASKTILPLWIALRILDLLAGGPARRRGIIRAQILR